MPKYNPGCMPVAVNVIVAVVLVVLLLIVAAVALIGIDGSPPSMEW